MNKTLHLLHPLCGLALTALLITGNLWAQVAPSPSEAGRYRGLAQAAYSGDADRIATLLAQGQPVDARDRYGRTPLHIAAYQGHHPAMRALVAAGADPNALEQDNYDIVTIAAVANDLPTLNLALELGCRPGNTTSPYQGTALIAAAHLGHVQVVRTLIRAGAPLDHINNLQWTALIEAIVLGDGGADHLATLQALVAAGADINLADGSGRTPLALAQQRGYGAMVATLKKAGAHP